MHDPKLDPTEPVCAQDVAQATDRFLARLQRMSALLERMEMDDHRMTALHRRAVVREFLLSARDCRRALDRFRGELEINTETLAQAS